VRHRPGGASHRRRVSVEIQPLLRPGSRLEASGRFLASGRSRGGGLEELGHGGAAWPGWNRVSAPGGAMWRWRLGLVAAARWRRAAGVAGCLKEGAR